MTYKQHKGVSAIMVLFSLMVCLLFTGTVSAQTSENYTIKKWVVNEGGGISSSSNYTVQDACGQPSAVGTMTSTNYGVASGFFGEAGMETLVEDEEETSMDLPQTFKLFQNYPNPFNPETSIEFDLPHTAEVVLTIYDLQGKEINRLLHGIQAAGKHTVIWTGKDVTGNTVSSGIYFYRIIVRIQGSESKTIVKVRKMIFMK